jgi:hypothetical protein
MKKWTKNRRFGHQIYYFFFFFLVTLPKLQINRHCFPFLLMSGFMRTCTDCGHKNNPSIAEQCMMCAASRPSNLTLCNVSAVKSFTYHPLANVKINSLIKQLADSSISGSNNSNHHQQTLGGRARGGTSLNSDGSLNHPQKTNRLNGTTPENMKHLPSSSSVKSSLRYGAYEATKAATKMATTTTQQNGAATSSSSSEARTPSQQKMDHGTSSLKEAPGNESRTLFPSASNRTTSASVPLYLLPLLQSGTVSDNIKAAKQALNEPNDIMKMPDGQLVPVYWNPDNNTLNMIQALNTKGKDHAVTKHLALGVLRLIFDGFKLKKPEDETQKIKDKIHLNVRLQVSQLKILHQNGPRGIIKVPWLLCLRPVVSILEQRNENILNAKHHDLTIESDEQSALRTALSVHPLLNKAFRSFGYLVPYQKVLGCRDDQSLQSSDNNTHCLDFKISGRAGGGPGTFASLPFASIHQTVMQRCSTRDVERLRVRLEELAQPFWELSLFYEKHGLSLVDVHDLNSDLNGQVSLINFVFECVCFTENVF